MSACVPVCGPGTQTRQRQRPCPDQPGVTQFDVQTFACEAEPGTTRSYNPFMPTAGGGDEIFEI